MTCLLVGCSANHDTPNYTEEGETHDSLVLEGGATTVVAQLSLAAPNARRFVLRGTLPLPPKLFFPGQNLSPFKIRDPQGGIVKAQVEAVSLYPTALQGADVVEVLALVQQPPNSQPGSRLTYDVLLEDNVPSPHRSTESVRELLGLPGTVVLRTRDVFGHRYEADLLRDLRTADEAELRILRAGPVARQIRTHEDLIPRQPVTGHFGTLPHLMGVHSYVTTWRDEEFISLDLRVHNGHDGLVHGPSGNDPMGKIYFDSLELVVPEGWKLFQAYPTPSMGTPYVDKKRSVNPIVKPLGGDQLHMMPPQAQFHRRFVLVREGHERRAISMLREEGLAFCKPGERDDETPFFSWWDPLTARYWAQNLPLPNLNYLETPAQSRVEMREEFQSLHNALTSGSSGPWPIISGNLGWAHPYGLKVGNMHGGSEIYFFDGIKTAWGASQFGYRTFQMTHRMYTERHATALFDNDGESFALEDWIIEGPNGPYMPAWMFMVPWLQLGDPFGFTSAPTFQADAVALQGRQPDYEDRLEQFQWIDAQHLIRYTRSAKVLAWLGNDAIAKDDLKMQAELCRATYTILPQTSSGMSITTGLRYDRDYVEGHPHDGFVIDRGEGWMLDTVASAYAVSDRNFRRRTLPWFEDVVDLIVEGQSTCSGTIMSKPNLAHFGGQYRILQSISETILQNGLWGAWTTALEGARPLVSSNVSRILERSTDAMISAEVWDDSTDSPHFYTALGPYDQSQPPFCGWVPNGGHEGNDGYQTWNVFVYGFRVSGNLRFLHRASQMAGGTLTPASIGQGNHPGELETRAGMISFLQNRESFLSDTSKRDLVVDQGIDDSGGVVSD